MEERNDRFSVLYANKVYCNCRMNVRAEGKDSNAFSFAMKMYTQARSFAEHIYEADREEERTAREKFGITPYGYFLSIEVTALCERLYLIFLKYSFYARFPGGKREDGERAILFDEKMNRPVSPVVFALIDIYENKKIKTHFPDRIAIQEEDIVLFFGKREKRILMKAFESFYLKLFP